MTDTHKCQAKLIKSKYKSNWYTADLASAWVTSLEAGPLGLLCQAHSGLQPPEHMWRRKVSAVWRTRTDEKEKRPRPRLSLAPGHRGLLYPSTHLQICAHHERKGQNGWAAADLQHAPFLAVGMGPEAAQCREQVIPDLDVRVLGFMSWPHSGIPVDTAFAKELCCYALTSEETAHSQWLVSTRVQKSSSASTRSSLQSFVDQVKATLCLTPCPHLASGPQFLGVFLGRALSQ